MTTRSPDSNSHSTTEAASSTEQWDNFVKFKLPWEPVRRGYSAKTENYFQIELHALNQWPHYGSLFPMHRVNSSRNKMVQVERALIYPTPSTPLGDFVPFIPANQAMYTSIGVLISRMGTFPPGNTGRASYIQFCWLHHHVSFLN